MLALYPPLYVNNIVAFVSSETTWTILHVTCYMIHPIYWFNNNSSSHFNPALLDPCLASSLEEIAHVLSIVWNSSRDSPGFFCKYFIVRARNQNRLYCWLYVDFPKPVLDRQREEKTDLMVVSLFSFFTNCSTRFKIAIKFGLDSLTYSWNRQTCHELSTFYAHKALNKHGPQVSVCVLICWKIVEGRLQLGICLNSEFVWL